MGLMDEKSKSTHAYNHQAHPVEQWKLGKVSKINRKIDLIYQNYRAAVLR